MGRPGAFAGVIVLGVSLGLVAGVLGAGAVSTGGALAANETSPYTLGDLPGSERLLLPGENLTTGSAAPGVDPGRSTSLAFAGLAAEYEANLLDAELDAATTSEADAALLRAEFEAVEATLTAIEREEREAYEAFEAGTIDATAMLVRLAIVHERAAIAEDRLDRQTAALRGITAPDDNVSVLRGEIAQLRQRTSTLQGPVRSRVTAALTGDRALDRRIHVQTSRDGYVLATIDGGIFLREAFLAPNQDRETGHSFPNREAGRERAAALYPWTFNESVGIQDLLRGPTYRASLDHPQGTTTVYLDGTTQLAFREVHELDLLAVPVVQAAVHAEAGVEVTVDRTYAGGPARVTVTDADDQPIADAEVLVDGRPVGTTDRDGVLWFVAPTETLELTVRPDAAELTLTVQMPVGEPIDG